MNKRWLAGGLAAALVVGGLAITALADSPSPGTTTAGPAAPAPAAGAGTIAPAKPKAPRWEQGIRERALFGAVLKASGKSREELRALKEGKTWQEVVQALGLDWTQIQRQAQSIAATGIKGHRNETRMINWLASKTGKTPAEIQALKEKDKTWPAVLKELNIDPKELAQARASWEKGAERTDGVVSFLSQLTGKTQQEILALKTSSKTWLDVAKQLGVTVTH